MTCVACGSSKRTLVLSLPATPPANDFVADPDQVQPSYPLDLYRCDDCNHIHLSVFPPGLFEGYKYTSGSAPALVEHFKQSGKRFIEAYGLKPPRQDPGNMDKDYPGDLVVGLGSNDGSDLLPYHAAGLFTLNLEPAAPPADISKARGIPTSRRYVDKGFSFEGAVMEAYPYGDVSRLTRNTCACGREWSAAKSLICPWCSAAPVKSELYARLVIANNVIAHTPAVLDMLVAIREMLHPTKGVFVAEVHWLGSLVVEGQIDSCYHEHQSHHSVTGLRHLFDKAGLTLFHAEKIPTHGGSIRVMARRGGSRDQSVYDLMDEEAALKLWDDATWANLGNRLQKAKLAMHTLLNNLAWPVLNGNGGLTLAVYGAPAKLTTLAYALGLDGWTQGACEVYAVDDSPLKQGLHTPGLHWPIHRSSKLLEKRPFCILLSAWNLADQIIPKIEALYGEDRPPILVPWPEPKLI